jgi:hypothetical protein
MKQIKHDSTMVLHSSTLETLLKFTGSDSKCTMLTGYPRAKIHNVAANLRKAIKTYRIYTVEVTLKDNELYLIRKEMK